MNTNHVCCHDGSHAVYFRQTTAAVLLLWAGLASVPAVAQETLTGTEANARELRIGAIGLDSPHCVDFAEILHNANAPDHVPGGRIVLGYKGGSPDMERSFRRIDEFTGEMQKKHGVKIVDSIAELCRGVDAVMILSIDGRVHLEQAREVMKHTHAKRPLFIDKPVATSLKDVLEVFRLARQTGTPVFSSSSLRYVRPLEALKRRDMGELKGVISYGPASIEKTHPDLFYYGVHAAESLYAVMSTGCVSVTRTSTPDLDAITGVWSGDRVGTLFGLRNMKTDFGITVFATKGIFTRDRGIGYSPLIAEIIRFYNSGVAPVPPEETIELFAFLEAANESKERGGVPVRIADVLKRAEEESMRGR